MNVKTSIFDRKLEPAVPIRPELGFERENATGPEYPLDFAFRPRANHGQIQSEFEVNQLLKQS